MERSEVHATEPHHIAAATAPAPSSSSAAVEAVLSPQKPQTPRSARDTVLREVNGPVHLPGTSDAITPQRADGAGGSRQIKCTLTVPPETPSATLGEENWSPFSPKQLPAAAVASTKAAVAAVTSASSTTSSSSTAGGLSDAASLAGLARSKGVGSRRAVAQLSLDEKPDDCNSQ